MLCAKCGNAIVSNATACKLCGTRVDPISGNHVPPMGPPVSQYAPGKTIGILLLAIASVLVFALVFGLFDQDEGKGTGQAAQSLAEPTRNNPIKATAQIGEDANKEARFNYTVRMQEEFENEGVEASISDMNGNLVVVSDQLKLKSNRDMLMRVFDPAYRRALCAVGFKTVELRSGVVFGNGEVYSLGCRETNEERQAKQRAKEAQREEFVSSFQSSLNNAGITDIRVEQEGDELVLTGSSAKDVPPNVLRAMLKQVSSESGENLCNTGFRGVRARSNPRNRGIFVRLNCGTSSH